MDYIEKRLLFDMDIFEEMFKSRETRSKSLEVPSIQLDDIPNYKIIYGDTDSIFTERRRSLPYSKI